MRTIRLPDVVLVLAFAVPGTLGSSAVASAQEATPLVKSEVVRLLVDDTYSAGERQDIVRRNCLTFSPSEGDLEDFRRLGASDQLLAVIRECDEDAGDEREEVSTGDGMTTEGVEVPRRPGEVVVSAPALRSDELWRQVLAGSLIDRRLSEARPPAPSSVSERDGPLAQVEMPPRFENPAEVQRRLREAVPEGELTEGREARCVLWVFVDETGRVQGATIESSSGSDSFDQAALEVARSMRFTPATSDGYEVATWVQQSLSIRR